MPTLYMLNPHSHFHNQNYFKIAMVSLFRLNYLRAYESHCNLDKSLVRLTIVKNFESRRDFTSVEIFAANIHIEGHSLYIFKFHGILKKLCVSLLS